MKDLGTTAVQTVRMEQAKHLSRGQLVALSLQIDASWGVSKGRKWTRQNLIDRMRAWVAGVEHLGTTAVQQGSVEPVELLCNLTDLTRGQLVSLCLQIYASWWCRHLSRDSWIGKLSRERLISRLRFWLSGVELSTTSLRVS